MMNMKQSELFIECWIYVAKTGKLLRTIWGFEALKALVQEELFEQVTLLPQLLWLSFW